MPPPDSPINLVARFLRANNYNETLDIFLQEAGLPSDTGSVSKDDITIEQILQEKQAFDLSVRFEKLGAEDGDTERGWRLPAPSIPTQLTSLPTSSNLLHVSVERLALSSDNHSVPVLIVSTADRRFNLIDPRTLEVISSLSTLHDSPILSCAVFRKRFVLSTSMSGQIVLQDILQRRVLSERRDHTKYTVKVVLREDATGVWIATAGWDAKVLLYWLPFPPASSESPALGNPVASITLTSNPDAVLFATHPESQRPLLLVTRRDSTFIYYYLLPELTNTASDMSHQALALLGRQNLAPHSNAWIAFTPSAIALCPTDPSLLAVATSSVPHMKLLLVRLLIPPLRSEPDPVPAAANIPTDANSPFDNAAPTQSSQARAALALQDKEAAAIEIQCNTFAPQTTYSTPGVAWRPDGSGVWVNGDDGAVRCVEAVTGKVRIVLTGGHEPGSKVRCLWAGWVEREGEGSDIEGSGKEWEREEWVVSGGFDKRCIVWKTGESADGAR